MAIGYLRREYEDDLRRGSAELFITKVNDSFEVIIFKNLRDVTVLTSKLRLLRAKPFALTPPITQENNSNTINNYRETDNLAVIEQLTYSSLTQIYAVKTSLNVYNNLLSPELKNRKLKIKETLIRYGQLEKQLCHIYTVFKEKQKKSELDKGQHESELEMLRNNRASTSTDTDSVVKDCDGPLYKILSSLVDRMKHMRWMMSIIIKARSGGFN